MKKIGFLIFMQVHYSVINKESRFLENYLEIRSIYFDPI